MLSLAQMSIEASKFDTASNFSSISIAFVLNLYQSATSDQRYEVYVTVDDAAHISNELVARFNSITTTQIENNWHTANCQTRFVFL